MPSDDYTSAVGGGLKLKGGITKKKKKSKKPKDEVATAKDDSTSLQDALAEEDAAPAPVEEEDGHDGKTEAERKREEMRRKRLDERLKKEGAKTHKQRVEELNKYLSNLSEHHDMPRIGPG